MNEFVDVPFVDEVEQFNAAMNKPNNYSPVIPDEKEWKFVVDFIREETAELEQACRERNIVEVLDALIDILYVSFGNGTMLFGLKDKVLKAFDEVQSSNLSKLCTTEEDAKNTVEVRSKEQKEPCHYEKLGENRYVVYRTRDRKVMKSVANYHRPDLRQFFTKEELQKV